MGLCAACQHAFPCLWLSWRVHITYPCEVVLLACLPMFNELACGLHTCTASSMFSFFLAYAASTMPESYVAGGEAAGCREGGHRNV